MSTPTLYICVKRRTGAGSCAGSGAYKVMAGLRDEIDARSLAWEIRLSPCLGQCADGPNIKAAPDGPLLHGCTNAQEVLRQLGRSWPPAAALVIP